LKKIKTIIRKEWAEVFKNRMVLFTVAFLPLIFLVIPFATLFFTQSIDDFSELNSSPGGLEAFGAQCAGLTETDCVQLYMLNLYTIMFMILPVAIPVTIAAYSIVGEKAARSLEPLLATPITTTELLSAKAIAAVTPAILATWLSYLIFLLMSYVLVSPEVFSRLLDPTWLIAILIVSPLLTLLSVSFAILISSRVTDPRVAEQMSALVVLPLILLLVGQSVGLILFSQALVLVIGLVVAILDVILLTVAIKLFQRETILTRWK